MTACTRSVFAMWTDFFASDDLEAAARRTGFGKRASTMPGKLFLALVTFGAWSEATTTWAPLAAQATQLHQHVAVAPEAIYHRMNKRALAFLQDRIRQALAKVQALENVCEDGRFPAFAKVSLADSTGCALPGSLHEIFPGSGGSAAPAGAKIQAVWDDKSSVLGHCALPPWNIPDQQYIDPVVTWAHTGVLFLFAVGYFKVKAFARLAEAGASFLRRLNPQTTLLAARAGQGHPMALAPFRSTVEGHSTEHAIFLGAKERVACRLMAYRVPEPIVKERRSIAKQKAKKKGSTPSQAHLALLAWHLFLTNVSRTIWPTETIGKVSPLRWHIARMFQSWKSSLHVAAIKPKKEDSTFCSLYGRMLRMLRNYALCPHRRATLWVQKTRELSVLKLVRHFQALADRWRPAILQSEFERRRFLTRACATAERLTAKAVSSRRTTAQILRESLSQHTKSVEFAEVINA